jgi:hypothetical protein
MTIPLTGTGGLFTRIGKSGAIVRAVNKFRGSGALRVTTLIRAAGTATCTVQENHGFTTGDTVYFQGVLTPAGVYPSTNGTAVAITVTSNTVFTFAVAAGADTATGTITVIKTTGVGFFGIGPYCDNLEAQYQSVDQNIMDTLYTSRDNYRSVHTSFNQGQQSICQTTMIQMANDDIPLVSQDLTTAIQLLIGQMNTAAQTVKKPTVSVAVTAGGANNTNGVLLASITNAIGKQLDYVIAEAITVNCTQDSQGTATIGSESLVALGQTSQADPLMWNYPLGSGANYSFTSVDAAAGNNGQNLLVNSSFDTFTVTDQADNWTYVVGTPTTNFKNGGSGQAFATYATVNSCLQVVGDGATLHSLTQSFNTASGGTGYKLTPRTTYMFNLWAKVSAAATGIFNIEFIDNNNNVINDDQSTANQVITNVNTLTTTYAPINGVFRTPSILPAAVPYKIRIRFTTALSNGQNLFFDHLGFTAPTQIYVGGPYAAFFAGSAKLIALPADTFTVTVTNKYDSMWQLLLDQVWNIRAISGPNPSLQIPSGGAPTIVDSLIA